ncbi:MAG TPA: hypothetical protein VFE46_08385 [Pirellulales bacterium]|jgi:hypothetical protein|nr:hypothetical protein [Pirellulales bacterium]
MTERRSFYRKLGYIVAIAVLWFPIYEISHPASLDSSGNHSSGGKLAQLRDEHQLSDASLGEIDPASQTAELATLGLGGVAVQLLWNSAHQYQMREDWASLSAVLDQIIRLEPHFWSVWDFQGHNLSYNISVEFDDYRDRFYWVMYGIDFLKNGVKYNSTDPRFLARIGWFYGNKIGRADEHVQYRRLFKKQQEEKNERLTDNWLVSHDWYRQAENLVESGKPLRVYIGEAADAHTTKPGERAPSAVLFFSEAAMSLINYADNLEVEGTFGDTAKAAWQNASEEWSRYADRDLNTSYGYTVRLGDLELLQQQSDGLKQQLETLLPGQKEKIHQAKLAALSEAEAKALAKKPADRTAEENVAASGAEAKTKVAWEEVILQAPVESRPEARKLNDNLIEIDHKINTIDTYRDIVNYKYWWARCQAEPTEDCLLARERLYQADQAYKDTKLFDAKKLYEEAFAKWRLALDQYPVLRLSSIMADDLVDEINKYKKLIGKIPGSKFPDNFVLQDMIDLNEGKTPTLPPSPKAPEKSSAPKNKSPNK